MSAVIDIGPHASLDEARDWLRARLSEGAKCPCCTRLVKVYKRSVTSTMAYKLILIYRTHGTGWFHMPTALSELGIGSRDESFLRMFGLIEEAVEKRDDGGRPGWWRITDDGVGFVLRRTRIPKYAQVFKGEALTFTGGFVGIEESLRNRFDYRELMGRD